MMINHKSKPLDRLLHITKGVRIDKAKALEYYKEAAANGLRVAAMNVEELEKESGR